MKKLLLILVLMIVFVGTAKAGTYDHTVHLSFAGVSMDSVIAYVEVNNTKIDSAKWFVFPVDSFVTVPDTAVVNVTYLYYQTGGAGLFETAWEDFQGNPTGGYIDSNLQGISNPNRIFTVVIIDSSGTDELIPGAATDLKNAALTTLQQKNGSPVVFSVNDATFTLVSVAGGFTCDTSVIAVTGNQEDTVYCYNTPDPGAAAGVDFVRVFLDVGEVHIDTLTGAPIPIKNAKFFVDIVGNPIAISGDWFLPPLTYQGKTNAAGRVFFDIPATTKMMPDGIYYVLRYEASSGRRKKRGVLGSFAVDTLPDPLKIIDAIKVWGANE